MPVHLGLRLFVPLGIDNQAGLKVCLLVLVSVVYTHEIACLSVYTIYLYPELSPLNANILMVSLFLHQDKPTQPNTTQHKTSQDKIGQDKIAMTTLELD